MSPLNIEVYNPAREKWAKVGERRPNEPLGSISQNKPDGTREVYLFGCNPDDKESIILKSKAGVDIADPSIRIVDTAGFEEISRLKDGESHTLSVKTDVSDTRRIVRFTHVFGT